MPITAVLLSAGYATRLYPLTKRCPKALLRLGSKGRQPPRVILDEVVSSVSRVPQLHRRILVTNHRFAGRFRAWRRARGADLEVLDDGTTSARTRLGAIGDLLLAARTIDPRDDLLVIGTDNLFSWSLASFISAARRHRPAPSVALWRAPSRNAATQFGVVTRNARSRITAFVEKSPQPPSRDVALCVYYFPSAMRGTIRQFLEEGERGDAPGYFIGWLVRRGPVYGVMMRGTWYDIGTPEAYRTVVREWPSQPVGSRQ
ncbi:MAG: sugar phosphate nucleotidyltransferase [Candidatus Omnitrophota bacterium]|nr:sugar phosphate nucleotidyltransferase [Candidatus Omnitrophota bacterium]